MFAFNFIPVKILVIKSTNPLNQPHLLHTQIEKKKRKNKEKREEKEGKRSIYGKRKLTVTDEEIHKKKIE